MGRRKSLEDVTESLLSFHLDRRQRGEQFFPITGPLTLSNRSMKEDTSAFLDPGTIASEKDCNVSYCSGKIAASNSYWRDQCQRGQEEVRSRDDPRRDAARPMTMLQSLRGVSRHFSPGEEVAHEGTLSRIEDLG